MKKLLITVCFITILSTSLFAFKIVNDEKEIASVKEVIRSAYVDGIKNAGDIQAIETGFHPGFEMLSVRNNNLSRYPIHKWIESVKKFKKENPGGPAVKNRCEFISVDVTGKAATAKIDLYSGTKRNFTDYFFLYKFAEGWRIVAKIYHRH